MKRARILKNALRRITPDFLLQLYRRGRLRRARRRNAGRSPEKVFRDVYRRNQWGGQAGEFFSGTGSEASQAAGYAEAVRDFVREHRITSIVDLGCGDYRVGALLRTSGVTYTGVDVVPELIEHNRALYANADTDFVCRNLLEDSLPPGELCLVRQVLQHLSNQEIATTLGRLAQYQYVLVTEHYPAPSRLVRPNLDKAHGPDTRVSEGSGVFLDLPPFSASVESIILESPVDGPIVSAGEVLRTMLLVRLALPP